MNIARFPRAFRLRASIALTLVVLTATVPTLFALPVAADDVPEPEQPKISGASDEGAKAIAGFRFPGSLRCELFAAEPLVANPVAFSIDEHGRIYVCESFRQGKGVTDNRDHDSQWLDADLATRTIADRLAYHRKLLGDHLADYMRQDDRIRVLADTNGDGQADVATAFANHFNDVVEGTGASVLAYHGNVYYTCIPNLWLLRDEDGDGRAEVRTSLNYGFGPRVAFRGHDLHGLTIGPDGRLYFSIGDRGFNVTTPEGRKLVNTESGGVLRCELDGSNLEVFATGLRNPQELAFDDFGNLFTGDNNSDSGDQARWVFVVEGSDSGWRMAYQYLNDRGPFNREKIWHPMNDEQPAFIVPPVANVASGPSGLAYYPGTGLSDDFQGRFLLVDFRGGPAGSGVRSFRVKPKGAFFELVDQQELIWNVLATDVAFGPDGAIYLSDWVNGWNGEGKGRIYRFFDPAKTDDATVRQVREMIANGLSDRSTKELVALLAHADRRIRQEAQFALVGREAYGLTQLREAAARSENLLARVHAVWGLGQIARREDDPRAASARDQLVSLLGDGEGEIRAQAARALGECRCVAAFDGLVALLGDDDLRARYLAAIAVGKLGRAEAAPALFQMLAENDNVDPILRHAAVMGLVGIGNQNGVLADAAENPLPAVRLGALLAMRRLGSPLAALWLNDGQAPIVLEAARAIYDVPISDAMAELAALIERPVPSDPLLRRVLAANYRLGQQENAALLAAFAARSDMPADMRIESLRMLADWQKPSSRDRVLGMWRPIAERSSQPASQAVRAELAGLVSAPAPVRREALQVAAKLGITEVVPVLLELYADRSQTGSARAEALTALESLRYGKLEDVARSALDADQPELRAASRDVLAHVNPQAALSLLREATTGASVIERQRALATLADMKTGEADTLLADAMQKLLKDKVPADTELDVLAAARSRHTDPLNELLARYEQSLPKDDPLAAYRPALVGGNADRGREVFRRAETSCVRCHKVEGVGGDVGPDLSRIAAEKDRTYLLESVVLPGKTIAKNFESVLLITDDGKVHSGIIRQEDARNVRIVTAEGNIVTVAKDTIEDRRPGKSAMPDDMTKHVTPLELRDLVEFLSTLK